jgi:hypothetical protein
MRNATAVLSACVCAAVMVSGCGAGGGPARAEPGGAYLGEGVFSTGYGSMDVQAQLALGADGRYQLLFLEPPPLAMMGSEEGAWSREEGAIQLEPGAPEAEDAEEGGETSTFQKLSRTTSANARPKRLTIDGQDLVLRDGKLTVTFRPDG